MSSVTVINVAVTIVIGRGCVMRRSSLGMGWAQRWGGRHPGQPSSWFGSYHISSQVVPSGWPAITFMTSSTNHGSLSMRVMCGVCYRADPAPKNPGPRHLSCPTSLTGLGRVVFFVIPSLCPSSGPRPTHTPDRYQLDIGGNKLGPVQGKSRGGPHDGGGAGITGKYPPPAPCQG